MKNQPTTEIAFIRQDGMAIDQLVAIRFTHGDTLLRQDQVFRAFTRAVTKWVETTEMGREAWINSSEDLNIGDLLSGYDGCPSFNRQFNPLLKEQGIDDWKVIYQMGNGGTESYDHVLASPENCICCEKLLPVTA